MIHDLGTLDRSLFDRVFDVCVIGSGPAGMTVALSLAEAGFDVALMEGGDLDLTEESQALYEGAVAGLDNFELDVSRLRFFGGSSNHWYGRTRPLDPDDFLARDYSPLSGWPITRADLDPYVAKTDEILDIDAPLMADIAVPEGEGRFREVSWRRSAPTRFGPKYQERIARAPNLALCLNANLVDLRLDAALSNVTGAVFRSFAPGDPGITLRASRYCLCLGGLENARVMLNFDGQMPGGIGNRDGLVGAYFQDHVAVDIADILFEEPLPEGVREISFAPTPEFQREMEALAMVFIVTPQKPRRISLPHQLARTAECLTPLTERLFEQLRDETLKCRANGLTEFFAQRDPANYPAGFVWAQTEQPLLSESRVTLGDARDALGMRRITLDWQLDDGYYATLRDGAIALCGMLAERGIGRAKLRNWLLAEHPVLPRRSQNVGDVASRHHMGTTRMAADPKRGVVDADCRVHGLGNLYIGGSSVFPTSGYANPTYTITQMSLRLSDHLTRGLRV